MINLKCTWCGSLGMSNYCSACGKILRCPSCGSYDVKNFCGKCGKILYKNETLHTFTTVPNKEKFAFIPNLLFQLKKVAAPLLLIIIIITSISFLFSGVFDNTGTINRSTPIDLIGAIHPEDAQKKISGTDYAKTNLNKDYKSIFDSGQSYISSYNFEDAITEFRKIPTSSPLYDEAQAKIDEILMPLAKARLDKAKKLFAAKDYSAAYKELQAAYGTVTPPLKESTDLIPSYEQAAEQGKVIQESAIAPVDTQSNITITTQNNTTSYNGDDVNSRWNKSPEQTTGFDWIGMTENQKTFLVEKVISSWISSGKIVTQESPWFVEQINTLYTNQSKSRNFMNSMNIVAVAGSALK